MSLRSLLLIILSLLWLSACQESSEQASELTDELPAQTLALNDLGGFQSTETSNWQIVGDVYSNRQEVESLESTKGEGVLANRPDEQNKANLFTAWEHGDLDLSLDFMLPKGSNSGIYLQGRYEVQLIDSWGKDSVTSGDCGGIYQRWQEAQQTGYGGHAPRLNACRAPGLWQHLDIKFKAPRFNEQGEKIADARFEEVLLNGTVIHRDVAVSGPTRGPAFEKEAPSGPLMIQGDHGPIAFQNIRYKTYNTTPVKVTDLQYTLFEGTYHSPDDLAEVQPVVQQATDSISFRHAKDYEKYALVFEGNMVLPADGEYLFVLRTAGPSWLYLDGQEVTNNHQAEYTDEAGRYRATLEAGNHPFRLVYLKSTLKWVNGIELYCEGPQLRQQTLQADIYQPSQPPTPLVVLVAGQPVIQRGFMYYQGEKVTHCTTVGLPADLHYAMDIKNASLFSAWSGDFIDVTEMWHERGKSQTAQPLGNTLALSNKPTFALLTNQQAAWPDSVDFDTPYLLTRGYSLQPDGMPIFHYQLGTTTINDYVYPGSTERELVRKIEYQFQGSDRDPVYCLIAEGDRIEQLPDGSYGVDNKKYYLTVDQANKNQLQLRTDRGQEQLIATILPQQDQVSLQYSIIW